MTYFKKEEAVREALDSVSPSFCMAKWKQVTLHLHNGHTHSCHHPDTHLVPISEIQKDPSALHNTSFKKDKRRQMIEGNRPSECEYCWKVEDSGEENVFSDRIIKSGEDWSAPYLNEVIDAGYIKNVDPTYVEVSFSNVCNFKCAYCAPHISSKWMEEIKEFGPYNTHNQFNNIEYLKETNKIPIPEKEYNPYVEAFWKWWPELYPKLHTFRITGGEPLLTKHTFKVLDWIIENPHPQLELAINSNLCVPEKSFEIFLEKVKIIQNTKHVKKFTIFTSCEAYGERSEYIRFGLDYNKWLENCQKLLTEIDSNNLEIVVMSTYNVLSITSYKSFLEDVLQFKKKFGKFKFLLDIPYLNHPKFLSIEISPIKYFSQYVEEQVKFVEKNIKYFNEWEVRRMMRIKTLFNSPRMGKIYTNHFQRDFKTYVDEYDRRRGTNFLKTFPEMKEFYDSIQVD